MTFFEYMINVKKIGKLRIDRERLGRNLIVVGFLSTYTTSTVNLLKIVE